MSEDLKTYSFRIDGIDVIEKHIFKIKPEDNVEFNFDIKSQSVADPNREVIITFVSVSIRKKDEEKLVARFICGFGYKIQDFKDVLEKEEVDTTKYKIPID